MLTALDTGHRTSPAGHTHDNRGGNTHVERGRLRPARRRVLLQLFTISAGLAAGLLLAEAALRLFSPGYSPLFVDIYRLDRHGLLALRPGLTRRHVSSEWDVTITVNNDGLRDRAHPAPADGGTVLALGDSFTFGWGVELDEAFPFVAEERLKSRSVRIIKAGFPGTGPTDQLQWLERYGDGCRPDLLVLSFFTGNDFTDVRMGGFSRQFSVRDGLMVRSEERGVRSAECGTTAVLPAQRSHLRAPRSEGLTQVSGHLHGSTWDLGPGTVFEIKQKLKRTSLVAQQAARCLWLFEQTFLSPEGRPNPGLTIRDRWLWEFFKIHLRETPPETTEGIRLTLEALDEIHAWCADRGVPLVLVLIPRSFQVYDWEPARWLDAYGLSDEDVDLQQPQRILTAWASGKRCVTVLDLLPGMRRFASSHSAQRLYFYPNAHMNAAGHRLTGTLLADSLRTTLPVSAPVPPSDSGWLETRK